jgi:hypothetical protein
MNSSQLSKKNFDIKLFKVFDKLKNAKNSKVSHKELKKVKQVKESLIVQLSESHVLIDSLKSENTMLLNSIDALENKFEKFSSDNLKSMLCIHTNISNKPDIVIEDLSGTTSHSSDSKSDPIVLKPMIVDTTCLKNYCLNNHVMPKSKESGTQGKFVLTCHNCGKIGHIRPNCYLLKSHRPWIKQDAPMKGKVENSSSSNYVPLHRRHIKGKGKIICERMLTLNLQRLSKSIPTKEACPPVITAASPVTSNPSVHNFRLTRLRFRGSCQQKLHQAPRHQHKFVHAN